MSNTWALVYRIIFSLVKENSYIFIFWKHIMNTHDSEMELTQVQTKDAFADHYRHRQP